MAFSKIKRAVIKASLKKANKHYKTDAVIGERASITRNGKDPVDVIFYYPKDRENMPVFVQIHGGGWVGMDAVDDDRYCYRLARELNAFVVNVNYKRLYEQGFPYPQEEIVDTVKWLLTNAVQLSIDPNKIILSGGSAGGHITAGASILLAQQNINIAGQLMEVPFLDFTGIIKINFPEENKVLKLLFDICPSKIPIDSQVLSPAVKATDETISKLAPAVIIVCGKDPLRPHGEYYAKRLKEHGKLVDLKVYQNGYHGFGTDKAEEKPAQDKLREDCFWYKVKQAKNLFMISGGQDVGE